MSDRSTDRLRVLMYLPGFRPDSPGQVVYRDFSAAVRTRGIDFRLVTDRPEEGAAPALEQMESVRPRRRPALDGALAPFTRNRRFLEHVLTIGRLIDERRPDLLYIEQVYPLGAAAWLALRVRRSTIPLVLMPSGEDVLMAPEASFGFRRFRLPRWLVSRSLAEAPGVRCISPLVRRTVESLTSGRLELVPVSVAAATIRRAHADPAPADEGARPWAADSLPEGSRLVVGMGRLHPVKGFDHAIEAVAGLRDVGLLLVGSSMRVSGHGETGPRLDLLAEQAGLGARYRRLDWLDHDAAVELLATADVVVAPSVTESQNRTCIEAAAGGTPFVVSEGAGLAGLIDREGVGIVVPSGDVAALAGALERALPGGDWQRDPDAVRSWIDRFAPETAARGVERLWRHACGSVAAGSPSRREALR